jgi:hypothetical protein
MARIAVKLVTLGIISHHPPAIIIVVRNGWSAQHSRSAAGREQRERPGRCTARVSLMTPRSEFDVIA